ncbi:MAG: sugar-transfer associated ATP-grasp domain-containing protein [Gammaproteobacteria bacterium]|nr:sugar-transfer associated ATP-grasp domain-containing protein [Gammaproteobacteria bacterium]
MRSKPPVSLLDAFLQRPEWWLVVLGFGIAAVHLWLAPVQPRELLPATVYDFTLRMSFESPDGEAQVRTFLPANDERQFVMEEVLQAPGVVFTEEEDPTGRIGRWSAGGSEKRREITYYARLALQGVQFDIPENLPLPIESDARFIAELGATPAIQVHSEEVAALWDELNPGKATVLATLRAIHDYTTHDIEGAEFKGYTDALTALRLRQASCNGKSRLFVALARLNKLPARLVGGIILNAGSKKTSHQWVEVFIRNQWVPFDPTNDHFASIPRHYLAVYRGDEALFSHTRNINFDYLFSIDPDRTLGFEALSPVSGRETTAWLPKLFIDIGVDLAIVGTLLLFPFTALLIVVARNIVGITTFGVFLPMLVGAACRFTGLDVGLAAFGVVVFLAALLRRPLRQLNLLQVPRISALVTIVTLLIFTVVILGYRQLGTQLTMLALFPVIIMSFTAERISNALEQEPLREVIKDVSTTTAMIIVCYFMFSSMLLQGVVLAFPELLLVVLGMQVAAGRWTGIRISEFLRFKRLLDVLRRDETSINESAGNDNERVLGMNARNRELVQRLNPPELIATANDKILSKTLLGGANVTIPRTLAIVQDVWDLQAIRRQLPHWFSFVIKPARGAKGKGILVIRGRDEDRFQVAGGEMLDAEALIAHMRRIIAGEYSMTGDRDEVLIETLIHPSAFYQALAPSGISDIRVILVNGEVLAAMLRIPTRQSDGKANLHRGGIGVPIDIETGITGPGYRRRERVDINPETGTPLAGQQVPNWSRVLELARQTQSAIPLGFIGVDIAEDAAEGPLVLEINARPGLEIQNVQGKGFAALAERLAQIPDGAEPTT